MDPIQLDAEHEQLQPANDDVLTLFLAEDDFVRLLGAEVCHE